MRKVSALILSALALQILLASLFVWYINTVCMLCSALALGLTLVTAGLMAVCLWMHRGHLQRLDTLRDYEESLEKVSHDLRAPLASLVLLARREASANNDSWTLVRRNADWMRLLVERSLDIRALKRQRLLVQKEPLNLAEAVLDVIAIFQVLESGGQERLEFNGPTDCWVAADPVRLRQVLFNLVGNAVKYTSGKVRITWQELESGRVKISISDEGPGLPKDFSRQFIETDTFKHPDWVQGSGIGLRLAAEIVEYHGSRMELDPTGPGTKWTWLLSRSHPPVETGGLGIRPSIVMIEDDALYARLFSEQVSSLADIRVFQKVSDFLSVLPGLAKPDLVVADYHLEGARGTDVLSAVKKHYGDDSPKLVLMSGSAEEDLIEKLKGEDIDGIWTKPLTPQEIREKLKKLFAD